jgi:hypothetical protein
VIRPKRADRAVRALAVRVDVDREPKGTNFGSLRRAAMLTGLFRSASRPSR